MALSLTVLRRIARAKVKEHMVVRIYTRAREDVERARKADEMAHVSTLSLPVVGLKPARRLRQSLFISPRVTGVGIYYSGWPHTEYVVWVVDGKPQKPVRVKRTAVYENPIRKWTGAGGNVDAMPFHRTGAVNGKSVSP